eukprot:689472_1
MSSESSSTGGKRKSKLKSLKFKNGLKKLKRKVSKNDTVQHFTGSPKHKSVANGNDKFTFPKKKNKKAKKQKPRLPKLKLSEYTFPDAIETPIESWGNQQYDQEDHILDSYLRTKYQNEIYKLSFFPSDVILRFTLSQRGMRPFKMRKQETEGHLKRYLQYHYTNHYDDILTNDKLNSHRSLSALKEDVHALPLFIYGQDKQGHPIFWDDGSAFAKQSDLEMFKKDMKRVGLFRARLMRRMHNLKLATSKKYGRMIYKHSLVMDLESFNSKKFVKDRKFHEQNTKDLSDLFPEVLHKLYIINAPWAFRSAWKVIQTFLHPVTVEKTKILGKDYMDVLTKDIDIEMIPHRFGGIGPWDIVYGDAPLLYPIRTETIEFDYELLAKNKEPAPARAALPDMNKHKAKQMKQMKESGLADYQANMNEVFVLEEKKDEEEDEEEESETEEYIGSDEFVSGLLIVTVYLSRDVFVKRNILRAMKHIKAFDALLDILQDTDEVVGITESFPLPLNDKVINKQHVTEFDTGLLYEKLKPKWQDMCVAKPDGMVSVLWNYQRKAVQWMLSRERKREMIPNLLWREMECGYEDINDASNNKLHRFWYHIDEGQFTDTQIPQLLDVRGGILADQMGLGKTVECLALINLNKQTHWTLGKPAKTKCIILDEDSEEEDDEYEQDVNMSHTLLVQEQEHKQTPESTVNDDCVEPDTEALEQYERKQELLCESSATLIVTPTNILHQWKNEIMKHSPHLKVYIYLGMKAWKKEMQRLKRKRKHKAKRRLSDMFTDASGMNVSQPRKRRRLSLHRSESITDDMPLMNDESMPVDEDSDGNNEDMVEPNYRNLGKYDVILTDYNVLKAESDYSNPLKYTFRRKKRHEIPDTPLLQIRWWRLILDEAQQIESKVSKCAQMALKVTSKYKWCVTGTPIGKNGLDDLYGLIKFLDVRPFNTQVAWLRTVAEPYYNGDDRRLFSILKRIMWRQAKHHVAKELNIPPRKEEFIELTFCGVEHEYYKKLHDDFMDNLKNEKDHKYQSFVFNTNTYRKKDASMITTGGIKQQLEILRQACCHPQISRQTFLNTTNRSNGGIMTMKQIMSKMIEDANHRMTQDERELCRAGTYYADWLIYRTSHQVFDNPDNVDSELELILEAIKVLEEVFKVEQSGIDNIETESILSCMEDDSIRCDKFDVSNLPIIEPAPLSLVSLPFIPIKKQHQVAMDEDDKLQMMMNDLNEGSVSPHKPLKMRLSVTPPCVKEEQTDTVHSEMMLRSTRPKRTRKQKTNLNLGDSDTMCDDDDDEDYVPPQFERTRNRKKQIYDSDTDSDHEYYKPPTPVPVMNPVIEKKTNDEAEDSDNVPILSLPSLNALSMEAMTNKEEEAIEEKFARHPRSSVKRLEALKVKDRVAVYMFCAWQPAVIIGKALNEVMIHFTHFDDRGRDMDQLVPLDPQILSIENLDYALKCAQMKQIQKGANKREEHKAADPIALNIKRASSRSKRKVSAYAPKIRISETNEKFYQWKKCEIATSHHLKYLYQRLLGYVKKFHLSARDIDILHKKIAVMGASLAECVAELQEQSQMKVANSKEVIALYEAQIDQWSHDLNIKEIRELVKIRAKLPIKEWQKKHFNKVHKHYNKYIVQKEEMQRKLQYSCFKLRSINLRRKLNDWIPSFPSIWDRINGEFRKKFLANQFESKMKVTAQSMRVIKTRHTFNQFLRLSLGNFERRMLDIYRHHRECADAINHSTIELTDQVSYYRSKWNDLSDITTLFRVFVQIFEDHKKLAKCEQELKDTEEKIAAHCAIVDDFDIPRWTVVGIENHLRNRYNIWKQKALGKSQQLRYLQQKHDILLNAGCRVDQECSICQQRIRDPTLTPCGHLFCEECILAWLQSVNIRSHTKACPQCRYRMTENEIFYVAEYLTQSNSSYIHSSITSVFNGRLSNNNADEMVVDNPKAEKSDTEEDDDEEHVNLEGIESGTYIDNIDIVGKGDYGTKIESLVKYIKYLSMHQPDAKSLVYSQFNQLLSIIAALLHENGIEVIHQNSNSTLSRQEKAKRIEKFQTDPAVKVLLLSLRTDSSGLTLIQATHVFLLEPSLNEAIELQAIDRVHRVGQTKPTFVHRYFMKGTVEENILRQRYNKIFNTKNKKIMNKKVSKFEDSLLDKGQNTEEMTIEELMKLFGND